MSLNPAAVAKQLQKLRSALAESTTICHITPRHVARSNTVAPGPARAGSSSHFFSQLAATAAPANQGPPIEPVYSRTYMKRVRQLDRLLMGTQLRTPKHVSQLCSPVRQALCQDDMAPICSATAAGEALATTVGLCSLPALNHSAMQGAAHMPAQVAWQLLFRFAMYGGGPAASPAQDQLIEAAWDSVHAAATGTPAGQRAAARHVRHLRALGAAARRAGRHSSGTPASMVHAWLVYASRAPDSLHGVRAAAVSSRWQTGMLLPNPRSVPHHLAKVFKCQSREVQQWSSAL